MHRGMHDKDGYYFFYLTGTEGGVRLYLPELTELTQTALQSQSWSMKAQAAAAMNTMATKLGSNLGPPQLGLLLTALITGLAGRTWTGKVRKKIMKCWDLGLFWHGKITETTVMGVCHLGVIVGIIVLVPSDPCPVIETDIMGHVFWWPSFVLVSSSFCQVTIKSLIQDSPNPKT